MTVAEAARRHGVPAESINRWRNRFVDAGKAAMEAGAAPGNVCPVRRLCHRADGRWSSGSAVQGETLAHGAHASRGWRQPSPL